MTTLSGYLIRHFLRIAPPLRIHVWGGFGSQLHAVLVYRKLLARFPNRDLILVFHSAGVTRRVPELIQLFPEISHKFIDDFEVSHAPQKAGDPKIKPVLSRLIKSVAVKTGFLSLSNSDGDLDRIRPWVSSVRGHYSLLFPEKETLNDIRENILSFGMMRSISIEPGVVLHYRLGDLLTVANKSIVDETRLAGLFNLLALDPLYTVTILSDSPEEAHLRLSNQIPDAHFFCPENLSTIETMKLILESKIFIGTNSKLSIWGILLRSLSKVEKSTSYAPRELEAFFCQLNSPEKNSLSLNFY